MNSSRQSKLLAILSVIGICSLLSACGGDVSAPATSVSPATSPTPASAASPAVSMQTAPGTTSNPILSAAEAANFTKASYFAQSGNYASPIADPWDPAPINTASVQADFVVGAGATYDTVQKAVNAAVVRGGSARIYIELLPGTYSGVVYVPSGAPPITVYGAGSTPSDVVIQFAIDAYWDLPTYIKQVNPSGQFADTDSAWTMYNACATQPGATKIDTPCAAVFWSQSDDFQLKNLTIINSMPVSTSSHQAVALRTDGDRVQIENLRLIGGQDTFYVNSGDSATPTNKIGAYQTTKIARAYVRDSYVEGDVDFVFGRANAVFDNCQFRSVSTRGTGSSYMFAPDTVPGYSYGFLVINSQITGDAGFQGKGVANLGRSWDQGASSTGYIAGNTPNGQLVIRDSTIDSSFNVANPWSSAATTGRKFSGNVQPHRNLDDTSYNRLWQYNNVGAGTGQ